LTRKYLINAFKLTTAALLLTSAVTLPVQASEMSTATYSVTQLTPGNWQYSFTLNDTGTTNIGTFWFSWKPGQDYMPTVPANITAPTGWVFQVTGSNNATDGNAVQWVANAGSAETPGQSLTGFSFDSATTPDQMAGLAIFHDNPPVATYFVYSGAPFSDAGFSDVAAAAQTQTPEPSTILLSLLGGGLVLMSFRRRA
jgi:hypothetical protein